MFLLAGQLLRSETDATHLALVLGITLCARWIISDMSGVNGISLEGDIPVLGVLAIPVLLIGAKASWSGLLKVFLWGMAIAMVVLLFQTKNRNAVVAFTVLLPALWLVSRKRLAIAIAAVPVLIVAGVLFVQSSNWQRFEALYTGGDDVNSANQRLLIWQSGWNMSLKHPVFGVGPGNFHNEVAKYQPQDADQIQIGPHPGKSRIDDDEYAAHNSIVHVLGESGFPGALLYLILFGGAAMRFLLVMPVRDDRGRKTFGWPFFGVRLLFAAMVVYLVIGIFISRQDMVLAYLLAGWGSGILAHLRAKRRESGDLDAVFDGA